MNFSATLVNLTPHELSILSDDNTIITLPKPEPNIKIPRISINRSKYISVNNITIYTNIPESIQNLPDPQPNTFFIVSTLIRTNASYRKDLLSPGEAIRNQNGTTVGCNGLDSNN